MIHQAAKSGWREPKRRFVAAGVFVRPIRNVVYLTLAFTIGEEDLNSLTGAVISVLKHWTRV
ncbi:MAG TPA: hypothetical protein VHT02_09880 [Methylocella sp.]|nr:hypothetical protein [Methylocella sp.]